MDELAFVSAVAPGGSPLDLYLLAASIREFGGKLSGAPIWICAPHGRDRVPGIERNYLQDLGVEWLPFEVEESVLGFPFGARVQAAAVAEKRLLGTAARLAWLDSDTLVLREPGELLIPPQVVFGFRPVHHRLLGGAWGEELDPFWSLIYRKCQASPAQDDYLISYLGEKIRPYFNAGSIVVRPEAGLQGRWWQKFQAMIRDQEFIPFFDQDLLYRIFMHQAVLTGVVLSAVEKRARKEFSPLVNYPLHLHWEIPERLRSAAVNDLTTARYEQLLYEPAWRQLPIREPLISWLEDQLALIKDLKLKP